MDLKEIAEAYQLVYEKKKLDPVGKEDDDVDNDGDSDSSDEYLKKRRAAISKAMGKDGDDKDDEKDDDKDDDKEVHNFIGDMLFNVGMGISAIMFIISVCIILIQNKII